MACFFVNVGSLLNKQYSKCGEREREERGEKRERRTERRERRERREERNENLLSGEVDLLHTERVCKATFFCFLNFNAFSFVFSATKILKHNLTV
jgi:hypothetical protein